MSAAIVAAAWSPQSGSAVPISERQEHLEQSRRRQSWPNSVTGAIMSAFGQGVSYDPRYWNVYVQARNRYVYFQDQASAQADINRYRYGQLMAPNGAAPAQPAAPATGKVGQGTTYNPQYWNVYVAALNRFGYFRDQASAQADIARFRYGQLVPPNSAFTPPAVQPRMNSAPAAQPQPAQGPVSGAPPSSTGWWQVHAGPKSWKFTDPALAVRCMQAVRGTIRGNVSPSSRPGSANPPGPTYV